MPPAGGGEGILMVYTVTLNPCVDYIVRLDKLTEGEINRTLSESMFPGGKGINVSVVLSALGVKNTALGFIAGLTGASISSALAGFGCKCEFTSVGCGNSRINVKIKTEKETDINAAGPEIPAEAEERLFEKIGGLEEGSWLVLSGSVPRKMRNSIYAELAEKAVSGGKRINIVADTTGDALMKLLPYRPFLIKPNAEELAELFVKAKPGCMTEMRKAASKLMYEGARNVLVSMAGDGAVLFTENGGVYRQMPNRGTVVNSAGAGDSMVAGFIAGFLNTGSMPRALRLGTAAGSATAFREWLADAAGISEQLKTLPETEII